MKKVTLFWFNNHYYVIPYMAEVSDSIELISKANAYLYTVSIEEENRYDMAQANEHNSGTPRIVTMEDTKRVLKEHWILSHDKSHLIATNDKSLGDYPTIAQEIIDEYQANWDYSFMFPYAGDIINGVIHLEVREDSNV
jgi:hypothetical protein